MTAPRLVIEALHAGYGGTEVLHGIDLTLEAGRSMCLVGPNGAGKSTVLNAIFGFADVTAGRIAVDGVELRRLTPAERLVRAGVAYVLQDSSVFPDLTVEQNLRLGGYRLDSDAAARRAAAAILERHPRLSERRAEPARVLSGGERRLLEIARAFVMSPKLLLVDEPSIGLEPRAVGAVFEMLGRVQREDGVAVLLVEQNVREGLRFADRGVVMVAGDVVRTSQGEELIGDSRLASAFLGR